MLITISYVTLLTKAKIFFPNCTASPVESRVGVDLADGDCCLTTLMQPPFWPEGGVEL